jgi:hypothetical protein
MRDDIPHHRFATFSPDWESGQKEVKKRSRLKMPARPLHAILFRQSPDGFVGALLLERGKTRTVASPGGFRRSFRFSTHETHQRSEKHENSFVSFVVTFVVTFVLC